MEIPEFVSGEKYNLKWNKHNHIIADNILEHLSQEELVDVTLSCEGKFIKAHKLILSASSQYFKELFQLHTYQNPIIIMTNIKFEYLTYIIDYIYKGEIKLLSSEIEGILNLANELQIKGLYGILNKSFEHLAEIKHDKSGYPKKKKSNNKSERSFDKPTTSKKHAETRALNIVVKRTVKNKSNSSDINGEKKREIESRLEHDRHKKRKISAVETSSLVKEINLSGIFRPTFPTPDNMEAPNSSSYSKTEANASNNYIPLPTVVPNSQESLEFLSKETKTNDISTYGIKVKEELNVDSQGSSSEGDVILMDTQSGFSQDIDTGRSEKEKSQMNLSTDNVKITDSTANKSTAVKLVSAFMLFTEEYRPILSTEYPDESVKQISLRLSSMWKNLPSEQKDVYYEQASKANEILKRNVRT